MEDWKSSDIDVDSLWLISERAKGGKRTNSYHGNFIPQIPYQLIKRYTQSNDTVLELFTGSGTTLFECETLDRKYIGFDINKQMIDEIQEKMKDSPMDGFVLNDCDVTEDKLFPFAMENSLSKLGVKQVDLLLAHPPYLDIVKFTDDPRDLSHISDVNIFINKLYTAFALSFPYLKKGGYMGIVMGDIYRDSQVVPLAFYTMNMIQQNFGVKLKGIIVKNIEGNRGKLGQQNIWKYRALRSDYYLFKHEYIFVFKKIR
ncbi:MAG: class I SAM-dependent methyltransferase [Porphyromonas sp.]|nr:class I SAM-dependent methyltransferase [Porphyromonas sp.]